MLVTISFAGVISLVSVNWIELTNGPLGLPGVPAPELFGRGRFAARPPTTIWSSPPSRCPTWCAARLVQSRIGRAFVALRENEPLAESIGVDVTHYLVLAAVVSAAMAGLGGSLYAHYTRFVSPEVFLFTYTVTMVIMVVAGGKGTLAGPLVGAVLFTVLPEALRAAASWQWQMLAYGVLLVLLVFFLPRGIVPRLRRCASSGAGVMLAVQDLAVRFGGVAALETRVVRGAARLDHERDRPERRRQDDRVQRDHRLSSAGRRTHHVRRRRADGAPPLGDRPARHRPDVSEARASSRR